jgi:hypothetical protein
MQEVRYLSKDQAFAQLSWVHNISTLWPDYQGENEGSFLLLSLDANIHELSECRSPMHAYNEKNECMRVKQGQEIARKQRHA